MFLFVKIKMDSVNMMKANKNVSKLIKIIFILFNVIHQDCQNQLVYQLIIKIVHFLMENVKNYQIKILIFINAIWNLINMLVLILKLIFNIAFGMEIIVKEGL